MRVQLYIEDKLLDLFKDESIELNSSVANVQDISKQNGDYTKTFTVPASERNNAIFKHYYNADIDNTFDARTKKSARIELDGMPFRFGKARLEKVSEVKGRASSYTIIFWGTIVNFKTLLKDDTLDMLLLDSLDHIYNYENVRDGLTTGLFDRDIIYTLLSPRKQYMYSSDPANNTDTDKLVNIAYNGNDRGVIWSDLKPSVRLLKVIEAIELKYGLTFSRDFFGRNEFKEIYMWLNNIEGSNYTENIINWTSGNAGDLGLNFTTDKWVVDEYEFPYNLYKYRIEIIPDAGYETIPYKIIVRNQNGAIVSTIEATGHFTTDVISPDDDPPFEYTFNVAAAATFEADAGLLLRAFYSGGNFDRRGNGHISIVDIFNIGPSLPKIKVLDFMKALFNMFKLVAIPDVNNNVYVNNIDDYYLQGKLHDITAWVDGSKCEIERGKILNTIKYSYQEPTTILNMEFKKMTGTPYGNEEAILRDDAGEILDGDGLEISIPFEIVVFERLLDVETNFTTSIQYGLITDDKLDPADPKGVIFYNNPTSIALNPISLLDQMGDTNEIGNSTFPVINTPGHSLGFDSPQFNILWGAELSTWNGAQMNNNLFTNYWKKYIDTVFNVKRRQFKFKAILPITFLLKLKLNDVLYIRNRYYRINDFTVDLSTRMTTLNLMNSFENNFGLFAPSQYSVFLTSIVQEYGVYVSNGSVMNIVKQDTGSGTSWATVSQDGYNIRITVTDNAAPEPRSLYINVDNGAGRSFQILLTQDAP